MRKHALILLFLACALAAPLARAAAPAPPTLAIHDLGRGAVTLDGPWQFHLGDDPSFASTSLDDSTGHNGWEQISAAETWGAQGHRSCQGYAWYRLHLHLTPATGASPDFALLIPQIDDVYQIYWNGALVAHNGKMPPYPSWRESGSAQVFHLGSLRDGVLAIRVWSRPLFSYDNGLQGGIVGAPFIGSPAAIAGQKASLDNTWLLQNLYFFAIQAIYAALFGLSLLAWLRDRSLSALLWMAIFCGGELAASLVQGRHLPIAFSASYLLAQLALALRDIGVWFLLLWLLKLNQNSRLMRATRIIAWIYWIDASADCLLAFFNLGAPRVAFRLQLADALLTVLFVLAEVYPLIILAFAVRKRLDPARWAVAVFAFIAEMVQVFHGIAEQGSRFTHSTLAGAISAPLFTIYGNPLSTETVADTALLVAIVYAVYRYSRETLDRQQMIEQELRSVQELQQVLVPETLPSLPGYGVTSAYRPAQEVGGDFYQIIPLEDGAALVVLGDVSGKGLKAAMTVALIVGAVRTLAETVTEPAEILAGLNRRVYGRLQHGFVTCLALRLGADGSCAFANAGHPSPLLNGSEVDLPGALPLGLDAAASYETISLHLDVEDRLTLYTDGLLEARSESGEIFGFDRLRELISSWPDAHRATEAAIKFGQQDDITVLTLQLAPAEVLRA